jgi:hypothetical protein
MCAIKRTAAPCPTPSRPSATGARPRRASNNATGDRAGRRNRSTRRQRVPRRRAGPLRRPARQRPSERGQHSARSAPRRQGAVSGRPDRGPATTARDRRSRSCRPHRGMAAKALSCGSRPGLPWRVSHPPVPGRTSTPALMPDVRHHHTPGRPGSARGQLLGRPATEKRLNTTATVGACSARRRPPQVLTAPARGPPPRRPTPRSGRSPRQQQHSCDAGTRPAAPPVRPGAAPTRVIPPSTRRAATAVSPQPAADRKEPLMPSSTRTDQHDDHGTPDEARIVQDHPARRPGSTCRPGRVRVHEAQISDQLHRRSPKLTDCEHQAEVARIAAEQNYTSPALHRALDKLKPSSRCPARVDVVPEIEVAAANRLPVMLWLYDQLDSCMPGRNADRRLAVAVLVFMTTLSRRPEVRYSASALRQSPLAMWVFDQPGAMARSSAYDHIKAICLRNATDLAVHANVELIRQLAENATPPATSHTRTSARSGSSTGRCCRRTCPSTSPKGRPSAPRCSTAAGTRSASSSTPTPTAT